MKITLAHGSGGKSTNELIDKIFAKNFDNDVLNKMEDSAILTGSEKIAMTTDSFVVTPLFFKGGDIGRLAICGTVNDLLTAGATPKYITSAFIIEEGADTDDLNKIAQSMAKTAKEAGVVIVAGDTKVIEGNGGVYINTTGVGFIKKGTNILSTNIKEDDVVIVSGDIGDHHATILSARMGIENDIESDNAPLCDMVNKLMENNIDIHCMRDVTRGGLGTVLNELADASNVNIEIEESKIPINPQVKSFTKILGLDICHLGNEGKMLFFVPKSQSDMAISIISKCQYGSNVKAIGNVRKGSGVSMLTRLGGKRKINVLFGEGLPRIC